MGFQRETLPTNNKDIQGTFVEESEAYRPDVLVGTFSSMGDGLNLYKANHLIMMEPSNKPTVLAQAWSRILRRGQTKDVHVHFLRCTGRDGVKAEENVLSRHDIQECFASGVFEDGQFDSDEDQSLRVADV